MAPRLKTDIWARAYIRACETGGAAAFIAARGDPDAGAVALKIVLLNGKARLFLPSRDEEGGKVWRERKGPDTTEAEVDALLAKERDIDADLWIIEVEDKQGRHFLTEPVIEL